MALNHFWYSLYRIGELIKKEIIEESGNRFFAFVSRINKYWILNNQ